MLNESALRIELHRRGKLEVLEVQADRALVGSGAHCDVRLAPDEAAVEQLVVEARDEAIMVKVVSFEPPCLLNGAPFLETRLSPDALIEMGQVALSVRLTTPTQTQKPASSAKSQTHPAVQALGVVGLIAGFYLVLNKPPGMRSALDSTATPPRLFQGVAAGCPHSDAEAARSLAGEALHDAENKRERSPFYPRDALAAVPLYERAAACFAQVGETQLAQEARQAAVALRERTADEQHVRHVRIERFIAQQKYDALRHEVLLAAELVPDATHPYGAWLSALTRETEMQSAQRRK
jgi:hypothetical protein